MRKMFGKSSLCLLVVCTGFLSATTVPTRPAALFTPESVVSEGDFAPAPLVVPDTFSAANPGNAIAEAMSVSPERPNLPHSQLISIIADGNHLTLTESESQPALARPLAVPEPASLTLLACGLFCAPLLKRRKR